MREQILPAVQAMIDDGLKSEKYRDMVGGISKAVMVASETRMTKRIVALEETVETRTDPGEGYITTREIMDRAGCLVRGRRKPSGTVSRNLQDRIGPALRKYRNARIAWPLDLAMAYMQEKGNAVVAEHNAAQGQQPELPHLRVVK